LQSGVSDQVTAWICTSDPKAAEDLAHRIATRGYHTIDQASTSSHLALHHAAQALLTNACDAALVVGWTLLDESIYQDRTHEAIFSPTNRVRAFDQAANGLLLGEGMAAVVLQRAVDATAKVHALLLGSAVTQNSPETPRTWPDQAAEERAIWGALHTAHVRPQDVHFVEMVANGTSMGDHTEVHAVASVLGRHGVALGGFNANLGHPRTAAGWCR
jgi:acyl transferase domain-containing protein